MKIALAQLDFHVGNFELNTEKIIGAIQKAKSAGADLVVFAELAVCGYPPLDFLEFNDFVNRCLKSIDTIAAACQGISAIVGGVNRNPVSEGKDLFNAAFYLSEGKIVQVCHKALLPTYDVFDEYRYFEPGKQFSVIECAGTKIALTICEDLWDIDENLMYTVSPMQELMKQQPELIVNIAASPFSFTHYQKRAEVLRINASRYRMPVFYVNHTGAQTEVIFDGGSMVAGRSGGLCDRLPFFEEGFAVYDTDALPAERTLENPDKYWLITKALETGIKDYFGKLGFRKAILGLSGGIDSALVCAIACNALGTEQVTGLLMPSRYSSDHSIQDAVSLADNLGCHHHIVPIEESFLAINHSLEPFFKGYEPDVTEENLQARIRGMMLMAFSNKFGPILLNTSNKSELAVGYGTLYGDMAGGLSVIGDLYKTEVYELARYLNRNGEVIPEHTIVKPPSAELRPDQKDSDSLPPYDVLDQVLMLYIEHKFGPDEIIAKGFDPALVKRVLKLVNTSEYKRKQFPPILRISNKAFGMGRRLPLVGKYLG